MSTRVLIKVLTLEFLFTAFHLNFLLICSYEHPARLWRPQTSTEKSQLNLVPSVLVDKRLV